MTLKILTEKDCEDFIEKAASKISKTIWERVLYHVKRGETVTYDDQTEQIHWIKEEMIQ